MMVIILLADVNNSHRIPLDSLQLYRGFSMQKYTSTPIHMRALLYHPDIPIWPHDPIVMMDSGETVATITELGAFATGDAEYLSPAGAYRDYMGLSHDEPVPDQWTMLGMVLPGDDSPTPLVNVIKHFASYFPSTVFYHPITLYHFLRNTMGIELYRVGPDPLLFSPRSREYEYGGIE